MLNSKTLIKFQLSICGNFLFRVLLLSSYQSTAKIEGDFNRNTKESLYVGAHLGQGRLRHFESEIRVNWIKAILEVDENLQKHISRYANQAAINVLLGDQYYLTLRFNLTSSGFSLPSINDLGTETGLKKLRMFSQIALPMNNLDDISTTQTLDVYDHQVIDVLGVKLLTLLGSESLLELCDSLLVYVSACHDYQNGATWDAIDNYLRKFSLFTLYWPDASCHENILFYRRVKVA